jgi:glycosyltransferase involved in cell wall biosynthesis
VDIVTAVANGATERRSVTFVLDTAEMGGTETYLILLVRGLRARGVDVNVVLSPAARTIGLAEALGDAGGNVEFHRMPRDKADLATLWGLTRLLRTIGSHVVHVVLPFTLDNRYAFVAARLAGCGVVVSTEQLAAEPWVFRRRRARTVKRALAAFQHCIIAASDDVRGKLIAAAGLPPSKVVTIHNGVEIPPLPTDGVRASVRAELALSRGTPLVGMVARIDLKQKRHDEFLGAAQKISARAPETHFLIVGGGEPRDRDVLMRLAASAGLMPRVHFLGYRTDARRIIGALDAFVLATANEGFPFVTLEAMALAAPVVVTDLGPLREQISHGTSGWLVPAGQPSLLADAVLRILADPEAARRVGAQARRTVVERFSVGEMAARTDALYQWALAPRVRARLLVPPRAERRSQRMP